MNKKQALIALAVITAAGLAVFYKQEPAPIPPEATINGHRFFMQPTGRDTLHEFALTIRPGTGMKDPEAVMQNNASLFCHHGLTPVLAPGWLATWEKSATSAGFDTQYRCKNARQLDAGRAESWHTGPFTPPADISR